MKIDRCPKGQPKNALPSTATVSKNPTTPSRCAKTAERVSKRIAAPTFRADAAFIAVHVVTAFETTTRVFQPLLLADLRHAMKLHHHNDDTRNHGHEK